MMKIELFEQETEEDRNMLFGRRILESRDDFQRRVNKFIKKTRVVDVNSWTDNGIWYARVVHNQSKESTEESYGGSFD